MFILHAVNLEPLNKRSLADRDHLFHLSVTLRHGFENLGAEHIVAVCHPDNLGSIRVMEKCGMTLVGEVVNDGVRVFKYVVLAQTAS